MSIGEYIRKHQPELYTLLKAMSYVDQAEDPDRAFREIESLVRHNAYRRDGGAIKQVRHE